MFNRRKAHGKIPNCRFEIGSLSCWSPGFYSIYDRVKTFLKCYGAKIVKERVSEVHLAADFIGVDIVQVDIGNQDKRDQCAPWFNPHGEIPVYQEPIAQENESLGFNAHFKHRKFTGMDMGSGDLMLRIYDKVVELKRPLSAHKQEIFAEIWGVDKFDDQHVTRVEYQLRRPKLREFTDNEKKRKIDTVDDLVNSLQSLWHYLTVDWTRTPKARSTAITTNRKQRSPIFGKGPHRGLDRRIRFGP